MNSKPLPFKKRENPLESSAQAANVTPVVPQQRPAPVTRVERHVSERIKYTATMDKGLRKRVKIALANLDIDFSKFVEECVKEKLEREGF